MLSITAEDSLRKELVAAARRLGTAARYRSAGTIEFLVDQDTAKFYFLEVNTRLQVCSRCKLAAALVFSLCQHGFLQPNPKPSFPSELCVGMCRHPCMVAPSHGTHIGADQIVPLTPSGWASHCPAALQVEHGITEMVSGLDLVNWQLQLQVPGLTPPDLSSRAAYTPSGWAIEVRINAEDPFRGFAPSSGILGEVHWPPGEAPHQPLKT